MKILALISSANHEGHGAKLTKAVCDEAVKHGSEVEYVYLYDLNFKSCGNCEMSKDDPDFCTKQDDLVPVMKKFIAADAIVLSAPIYMDNISGTAKTFLDRFCIFVNPDHSVNHTPGKKLVMIITSGAPAKHNTEVLDNVCETFTGFFQMELVDKLIAGEFMSSSKEIPADIMEKTIEIGRKLSHK